MVNRIKAALEFLENGQPFTIGDLRLETNGSNLLIITGWSQYLNFSSLTKAISLNELNEIKSIFSDIINASDELKAFITNKTLEYILCYDDGGKTSINICSEKDGIVKWQVALK